MTSLGEDSMGSLPISDIAALQDHLLQNGQPSAHALTPRTQKSYESQPLRRLSDGVEGSHHDPINVTALVPSAIAAQPPRLTPSKSAPAEIDAMVNHHTPSQDATMARAASFHGYSGGDTQPMESQIYRDYTESMTKSSGTTPKKTILHFDGFENQEESADGNENTNDKTQHTMDQGDEGFVNLDMAWQPQESPTAKSATSGIEELLADPETQSQNNGTLGALAPHTPGLVGSKRRRSGDISTSVTDTSRKTPGFSQMFGTAQRMPALSATQLFEQTQAPSSPMADAIRSDPIGDRPSPMINVNSQAFPDVASSSPMLMMHNPPASTAGEPRDTYTSMRDSQERRAARLRKELDLPKRFGPGAIAELDEEEEEDSQQLRIERKRLHRVMSDHAMDEWSRYRAPARKGSHHSSSRKMTATIDLVTPGTLHKPNRVQFDMLDDDQETDDEHMDVELPAEAEDTHDGEGLPEDAELEDYNEDNDVYDEFSQAIMRSQRDPQDDEDEAAVHEDDEREEHDDAHLENGQNYSQVANWTAGSADVRGVENAPEHDERGTQPAVADSQPERMNAQRSLLSKDTTGQPHTSSIVPGSQYAGATSQELARHSTRVPNSSTRSQSRVNGSAQTHGESNGVPSSPPVSTGRSAKERDENFEDVRQNDTAHTGVGYTSANMLRREVPESDQADHKGNADAGTSKERTQYQTAGESNAVAPFSTAQTHLEDSAPASGNPRLMKETSKATASQQSMPTPLKAAGVRRFADITADPSPPEFGGESQLDMDDILGNVITMDDQNFMDVLSSPASEQPTKRRKLQQKREHGQEARITRLAVMDSDRGTESIRGSSPMPDADAMKPTEKTTARPPTRARHSEPNPTERSPSKVTSNFTAPSTPESVREREQMGSKAASQLVTTRAQALHTRRGSKSSSTEPNAPETLSKSSRISKSRGRASKSKTRKEEVAQLDRASTEDAKDHDHDARGSEAPPPALTSEEPGQNLVASAPGRVLALFRGASYNAYYPATWLSTSMDGKSHTVRFDDTTVATLDDHHVRSLEFRIGDAIKIDYEGFRSKTWLITSFGRKAQGENDRANGVDIHDHVTLFVQAKVTQRNSTNTPAKGASFEGEGKLEEIMVTNVKVTHSMMQRFADRKFRPPTSNAPTNGTPSIEPQGADDDTPRSRRAVASNSKSTAREHSKLREESVASSTEISGAGIFDGMAFAITYASNENEKFDVTRLIRRNGGIILEQGFDELFITSQLDDQTTPTKRASKKGVPAASEVESGILKLKPQYEHLGFIALVADKHSRRAKYMQALALDLPTLSGRWILDSFDPSRNPDFPASPRPWTRYLLPAGESSYLGGAVRSRTLQHYDPSSAKLASTVAKRPLLLNGSGVLLVAPKKGKGTWERRKAYAFLTLALGAGNVRRVVDLREAKELLASDAAGEKWAWVYVDDDVSEAAKVLFGVKSTGGGGKKRKRIDGERMCVEGLQGRVRVVGDEFVVQSLILGALVD